MTFESNVIIRTPNPKRVRKCHIIAQTSVSLFITDNRFHSALSYSRRGTKRKHQNNLAPRRIIMRWSAIVRRDHVYNERKSLQFQWAAFSCRIQAVLLSTLALKVGLVWRHGRYYPTSISVVRCSLLLLNVRTVVVFADGATRLPFTISLMVFCISQSGKAFSGFRTKIFGERVRVNSYYFVARRFLKSASKLR